jgi:hypothetical protein
MKMNDADVFVILRHCQFEKNGFQNRFQYEDKWMTMPIKQGIESIYDKRYVNPHDGWAKIKRKITGQCNKFLDDFDQDIEESLWQTNYNVIKRIALQLGINTKIILDEPTTLRSTERLVQICKDLGATKYIAGTGGKKYLDTTLFDKESIDVQYQNLNSYDKIHTIDKLKLVNKAQ